MRIGCMQLSGTFLFSSMPTVALMHSHEHHQARKVDQPEPAVEGERCWRGYRHVHSCRSLCFVFPPLIVSLKLPCLPRVRQVWCRDALRALPGNQVSKEFKVNACRHTSVRTALRTDSIAHGQHFCSMDPACCHTMCTQGTSDQVCAMLLANSKIAPLLDRRCELLFE